MFEGMRHLDACGLGRGVTQAKEEECVLSHLECVAFLGLTAQGTFFVLFLQAKQQAEATPLWSLLTGRTIGG